MVKILISGDFCPTNRIANLIEKDELSSVYNDFVECLKENDLNVTNLEAPLYDGVLKIKKTGPNLKVKSDYVKALNFGNFHLVTLANNHIMDYGQDGLISTINTCKNNGISFVGAGLNLTEARKSFIREFNGVKIGILNFAENEFSTSSGDDAGANPLNTISNFNDIRYTKGEVDYLFVIVHGGHEYYELPSPRMQETYRFFVDAGADAVIGHHTHCSSGYEIYNGKPIFYSLGNFIFDWPGRRSSIWNLGYAVQFIIDDGQLLFNIIPYFQGDEQEGLLLLNEVEKRNFYTRIEELNNVIQNPVKLQAAFVEFINSNKKNYLTMIQPYSNRYLTALYYRGFIPSVLSENKKRLLLNFARCESHRDMLIGVLKD
jgi:hypothetical protein